MQLTWLPGAPSRSASVYERACGRCGLGSPATQLMQAVSPLEEAKIVRHKRLWIAGALAIGLIFASYYMLERDIWQGRCWLPRSYGYDTLTLRVGEESRDFCFRIPVGRRIARMLFGPDNGIVAYATFPGEPMLDSTPNPGPFGPGTEWYVQSDWPNFVRRFHPVVDTVGLRFSPDASWVALEVGLDPNILFGATYDVYNTRTNEKECTYSIAYGWFSGGCDRVLQSNGEYWNIQQEIDVEFCRLYRDLYASDSHCADFTDQQLTP